MRKIVILAALAAGAGKDVSAAGKAVTSTANDAKK
jgi:hypothetical protein